MFDSLSFIKSDLLQDEAGCFSTSCPLAVLVGKTRIPLDSAYCF